MGLTVTLVRHGNTDANNERWIQGQVDTELNTVGLDQANRCGHRLKDEQFQHVYCSDLKRCKQTAAAIVSYQPNVSIEYDVKLRERDFGKLSRRPLKYLKTESARQQLTIEELVIKYEGESVEIFKRRIVEEAYERIIQDAHEKGYQRILVVTHGGSLRHLGNYWIEQEYKAVDGLTVKPVAHGNTAVTKIEDNLITEYNSTSHLGSQYIAPPPAV
ncbi:histidine phosphatase superfamily [Helicostylum pulchrum]|uniref:Phosphoglycerate mutase n=1 Tax=Helicostylum pulchrum TaxID=562976 RepID=A0ABP9XVC3_9FUNG|nr:histidine phosphatase superfamily [Helicostylum pulchrum]